jgi:uncharacterized protein (DUF924 family)
MSEAAAGNILSFWRAAGPEKWWKKDEALDQAIRAKFLPVHEAAARGELNSWEQTAEGALALILLFDQFPRHMFRGSPHAFATDALARAVATRALARGLDQAIDETLRLFFYMPLMHSEILADQEHCVQLFAALGHSSQANYALVHRNIIAKFGRFPHRNRMLGRDTTAAEQAFLDGGGFAG